MNIGPFFIRIILNCMKQFLMERGSKTSQWFYNFSENLKESIILSFCSLVLISQSSAVLMDVNPLIS